MRCIYLTPVLVFWGTVWYNSVYLYAQGGEATEISEFADIFRQLDWSVLTDMLLRVIPILLCLTVHELCHGLAALWLGDTTAKEQGRLSLNPLRHVDIMGALMMMFFRFGWAKPVPVNMWRFKNPKTGMAITALAGPASNVLLALFAFILYGFLYVPLSRSSVGWVILTMTASLAGLSLSLGIFNLIPIPPLDGSKILFALIPNETYYKLMRYERYGMIALLILVATGLLSAPLGRAVTWVYSLLEPTVYWGLNLYNLIF